jgi:hypothetical protein
LDFYGKSVHGVTYWSVGLGELEAEAYADLDNPMGWALASWMGQQRESRVELRVRLVERIVRLVKAETYQELLLDAIRTYYKLSGAERRAEERLLRTGRYGEVEAMAQTVFERMEARARREGAVEALQGALVGLLRSRFPGTPESIVRRIERIRKPADLEELINRVGTASSLEEIQPLLGA